jgi:hypothetical protein
MPERELGRVQNGAKGLRHELMLRAHSLSKSSGFNTRRGIAASRRRSIAPPQAFERPEAGNNDAGVAWSAWLGVTAMRDTSFTGASEQ